MKQIQDLTSIYARKKPAEFADNLCLFFCYNFCKGKIFKDEKEAFDAAEKARLDGFLGDDGFVLNAEAILREGNCFRWSVQKEKITTIDNVKKASPVCFEYKGHAHWVVVENGKIVFNSLENSVCVKNGKPVSMRIIRQLDL
ncbi:hypothetical protein [Treponema berlinense]|uniref:hypothetical protein n=1 Tax=Treponema berlinense TaxID=225004 RepID=UPI003FD70421